MTTYNAPKYSTVRNVYNSRETEYNAYDKLPAIVKIAVMEAPMNLAAPSIYRAWMKRRRNGWSAAMFADYLALTVRNLAVKDARILYGENYPL